MQRTCPRCDDHMSCSKKKRGFVIIGKRPILSFRYEEVLAKKTSVQSDLFSMHIAIKLPISNIADSTIDRLRATAALTLTK